MSDKRSESALTVVDAADPADVNAVSGGLRAYNVQFAAEDWRRLYVFLRDEAGAIVGGLLGDTGWGWLSVHILWIDERYRGRGLGDRVLRAAEDEARARGCRHAQLDTLTFQARPFYEARGYRVYGTLDDFPTGSGHQRFYLVKDL